MFANPVILRVAIIALSGALGAVATDFNMPSLSQAAAIVSGLLLGLLGPQIAKRS